MPVSRRFSSFQSTGIRRIIGWQLLVRLASMFVDGAQGSHASIGDIRSIFLSNIVVLFRHASWVSRECMQRRVQPFRKDAFYVIAIATDGLFAPALSQ